MNSTEKAQQQETENSEEFEIIEGTEEEAKQAQAQDQDDGDEESGEDERLSDTRTMEEDARREAKRAERQRRKQNQKFARDKTKEEMQWLIQQNQLLQQRLQAIENQTINFTRGNIDQTYNQALMGVRSAEQALAKAIEIGDGARVPELLRQRDHALAKAAELNRVKQKIAEAPPAQTGPSLVDMKANRWATENSWFKPTGSDPDSDVVRSIDAGLVREGLDPATDEYWEELDRRIAKYLPHRFADEAETGYTEARTGRRGPPVGGSREMTPGKVQVYLSPARVDAMKDAGAWDDPVRRKEMLKRFAEWDRQNKAAR
ncbi:MAG: hypothetical protein ACO26U_05200 [Burkholderiaceae bacterium]